MNEIENTRTAWNFNTEMIITFTQTCSNESDEIY